MTDNPTFTSSIHLDVSESKGTVPSRTHILDNGRSIVSEAWGTCCPGCRKLPAEGEQITRIDHTWWHATCGAKYLRDGAADEAWMTLAHQLERAPSRFTNPETKAIVRNLLRIAGRFADVGEAPDGETVRGPAAARSGLRVLRGEASA